MKHPIMTGTALNILLAAAMPAMADDSNPQANLEPIPSGFHSKGERINARLDHRVDRIQRRVNRRTNW